jgi:DNA recombination-mediator protein A
MWVEELTGFVNQQIVQVGFQAALPLLPAQAERTDDRPDKLIFPLEHAYSQASLSFDALEGADAARAGVLVAAARAADCDLHLALLSIDESGSAEYTGNYRSYRRGRSDDAAGFDVLEWDITSSRCVAIVGTRKPTDDGIRRAAKLARHFAKDGFTVVSGLAQGVDCSSRVACARSANEVMP